MATLYEIDEAILQCIDMDTGEIVDEERLNTLQMERDKKIENVALWYKNLMSDAEAYKKEKELFDSKLQSAKKKAVQLQQYLDFALNGEKFSTPKVNLSYRKSISLKIEDEDRFKQEHRDLCTEEIKIPKKDITELIKSGREITGAKLVENQNLQIK